MLRQVLTRLTNKSCTVHTETVQCLWKHHVGLSVIARLPGED